MDQSYQEKSADIEGENQIYKEEMNLLVDENKTLEKLIAYKESEIKMLTAGLEKAESVKEQEVELAIFQS